MPNPWIAEIPTYRQVSNSPQSDRMTSMPIPAEEFQEKIKKIVRAHYAKSSAPLLLAHLGAEIEKLDAWPSDRSGRSLKQLIQECAGTDLQIVWDKRSPAYIAVVTPDVRSDVETQIAARQGNCDVAPVRLEDIARPVLLAFCVDVHNEPVYVRRRRPFRYEIGALSTDRASEYIIVEPEYRRAGLRVERLHLLALSDRRDLEGCIQKWAAVHNLQIEQFSRLDHEDQEAPETGRTALDRLLAAQPEDVAQRILIPADIAQMLARVR